MLLVSAPVTNTSTHSGVLFNAAHVVFNDGFTRTSDQLSNFSIYPCFGFGHGADQMD